MKKTIKLEKLNKNEKQGKVTKIAVSVGDTVKRGDKLMQIESAKGATPVKSKYDGKVISINAVEGKQAKLGSALIEVEVAE